MTRSLITLVALTTLGTAGAANAAHPLSVAGTWNATANQTLGVLAIAQPASAATCKPINGTIFGNTIEGYYCPAVGRIVFARRTGGGTPFQLYEAHVSRDGVTDRIGGSFLIWNASGGGFSNEGVDFNFSATK
ncbi:MAG: hypothetical protein ACT4O2_15395 [Beijerinckiaceae bacterium]